MGSSKQTQDERVRKILAENNRLYGARPTNFQTIHDAIKKCRGDFRAERNLYMTARQLTTDLNECFEEELSNIPSLSPDEQKDLLSDVHKYNQRLLELLKDGKDEVNLDFAESEILTSEHISLVKRLRDLQKSAGKTAQKNPAGKNSSDTPVTLREFIREYCEPLTKNLLERRVLALQGLNQKHKLKPPLETVTKIYKPGQSHKFLPSFLIANWPKYIEQLPSLPKLK